jgi:Glycosyltransferase
MAFSSEMDEIGIFKLKKVWHLVVLIAKIYYYKIRFNIKILYYPPAGPNLVPILRDIVILLSTRFLFEKVIFHFHAGGVSEFRERLKRPLRRLFDKAYDYPTLSIRMSNLSPEDGRALQSKTDKIVPYGIDDHFLQFQSQLVKEKRSRIRMLYVGVIKDSKGVEYLIRAIRFVVESGNSIELRLMGKFDSAIYELKVRNVVEELQLTECITFCGVKSDIDKWQEYYNADIFCFPTFFESEAFPVVLLEAMQFSLPIVTTKWRAIPGIVHDGIEGYIVPIKDSGVLADKIRTLVDEPKLRSLMGDHARARYLTEFQSEIFHARIQKVFAEL